LLHLANNVTVSISVWTLPKFSYFLCKLHVIELHDVHPLQEKKFHLLHTSKSTAKICAPCSQLSNDVILQFGKSPKIASIYYIIFIEEVPSENWLQSNQGNFEVQSKQGNFEILQSLFLLSNLIVVQKIVSSTMSKTT
jgi:hypothetical protein